MIEEIVKDSKTKLSGALDNLQEELKKIRTGRAQSTMVEGVKVNYYGSEVSLVELASITTPESNMIQIKPFDKNSIADIENAIRNSDLGLAPINDGTFVRITIPPLNEERRKEIVKQVKQSGEQGKISIRNIRGEAWLKVKELERKGQATKDDHYQAESKLNDLVADFNKQIDEAVVCKEQEIMKI